jgi:hypothetical protein
MAESDLRGNKKSPAKVVRAKSGKAQGPESDFNNAALAAANKATDVRTFAVRRTSSGSSGQNNTAASSGQRVGGAATQGKWAAGAFANSPAPSTLPKPTFFNASGAGSSAAGNFFDPAILSSRPLPAPAGAALAANRRVTARFHDGEYYNGTSKGTDARGQILVIFDGYEDEGAYPIPPADVQPLQPPAAAAAAPADPGALVPPTAWATAPNPTPPAAPAGAPHAAAGFVDGVAWAREPAAAGGPGHLPGLWSSAAPAPPPPPSEAHRPAPAGPPPAAVGLEELERMLVGRAAGLELGPPHPAAGGPTSGGASTLEAAAPSATRIPPARVPPAPFLIRPADFAAPPPPPPPPAVDGGGGGAVGPARSRRPASAMLAAALSAERS